MITTPDLCLRLVSAVLIGGLVGANRETHAQHADRTDGRTPPLAQVPTPPVSWFRGLLPLAVGVVLVTGTEGRCSAASTGFQ